MKRLAIAMAVLLFLTGLALTGLGLFCISAMPSMASADGVASGQSLFIAGLWGWHLLPYAMALVALVLVPWRWSRHCRALAGAMVMLPLAPLLVAVLMLALDRGASEFPLPWQLLPVLSVSAAALTFFVVSRFSPPAA